MRRVIDNLHLSMRSNPLGFPGPGRGKVGVETDALLQVLDGPLVLTHPNIFEAAADEGLV